MYEMKRTVNCSQIGSHGIIRNSCLVDLLQDCSVIHLDTHPVMSPFFEKENCVMFLVSRQLDIVRRPEQNEKLTVKTWTYELKRMYGYRNTVIYDENGDICVKSIASGAFMDKTSQRPIKAPQELVDRGKLYPKLDMEYLLRKIALPDTEPQVYEDFPVLKCYIDMNEHVNNARYLDITDEFVENESAVKRIRVEYKNPLKRGKAIKAHVYTDEGRKFVELCDENNKPYCITEYDYRS